MSNDPQDNLVPVNVWLAGRSYRLRVPATDEARVRRIVKDADLKIQELRQHYAGKDDQDFVAMCLLMYATEEKSAVDNELISEEIDQIIHKIDKALEE
jgi:cell division protein ZapA